MLMSAWMRSSLCRKIGSDLERLLGVAVASLDDLLVLVERAGFRSALSASGWLVASA